MSFYTKPPTDTVSKHDAQDAIQARFDHHMQLRLQAEVADVDNLHTLDVDNVLDHVSHTSLKLIAVTCRQFHDFFVESEVELFRRRMERVTEKDARRVLERAVLEAREGKDMYRSEGCVRQLDLIISTAISMLERCAHAFHRDHPKDCVRHHLRVHFTECTQLVARRAVELRWGTAWVPCSLWRHLLRERFERFLLLSTQEVKDRRVVDVAREDPRVWPFLVSVRRQLLADRPRGGGRLTARDLEGRSRLFPVCMRNALARLRERHRLTHEARRCLSLFLKDAGMDVREALAFWASEYSKHAHEAATCSHSWQKDCKKLTYSVRHMYGLEGSRICYGSFSCGKIQAKESEMRYEVVCPFTDANLPDLERLLPPEVTLEHPTLLEELRADPPLSAKGRCHLYLRACHGCPPSSSTFESPIGYYRCALEDAW